MTRKPTVSTRTRFGLTALCLAGAATLGSAAFAQEEPVDFVVVDGQRIPSSECGLPLVVAEGLRTAQPLRLRAPENSFRIEPISEDTEIVDLTAGASVTVQTPFRPDLYADGLAGAAASDCGAFWQGITVLQEPTQDFYDTSGQFTLHLVNTVDAERAGANVYEEYTFMWVASGLPVIDAEGAGIPLFLDGFGELVGFSDDGGTQTSTFARANDGGGADNFGNPLFSFVATVFGEDWLGMVTPGPAPVTVAGTAAAERAQESLVSVVTDEPLRNTTYASVQDIADGLLPEEFDVILAPAEVAPPASTVPESTAAPTTTPPATTPPPATTEAPAAAQPPATTAPPSGTQPPASTEAPASTAPPVTDAPNEAGTTSDERAENGGSSALPILIVLALAFGVGTVLLWLLVWRPRAAASDTSSRATADTNTGHDIGGIEAEMARAREEEELKYRLSLERNLETWNGVVRTVIGSAEAAGHPIDAKGVMRFTPAQFERHYVSSISFLRTSGLDLVRIAPASGTIPILDERGNWLSSVDPKDCIRIDVDTTTGTINPITPESGATISTDDNPSTPIA